MKKCMVSMATIDMILEHGGYLSYTTEPGLMLKLRHCPFNDNNDNDKSLFRNRRSLVHNTYHLQTDIQVISYINNSVNTFLP